VNRHAWLKRQKYLIAVSLRVMTIETANKLLTQRLAALYEIREAGNIAALVMERLTGMDKVERMVHKQDLLSDEQLQRFELYARELEQQRPVQYVLGEAWFAGMNLFVDENVLVPRPETEELIEWVVEGLGARNWELGAGMKLIDIGTGSGCIALALQRKLRLAAVWAMELSEGALQVARRNAGTQQLNIHFVQQDFLDEAKWIELPAFDMIVSNPPYVPYADKAAMQANVLRYEPHTALFVPDDDALLFYKKLAAFAATHLLPGGSVYAEIHESRGKETLECFAAAGFEAVLKKDLQGKERMVRALRK
jgi:release factor glutamine methyltransferase